MSLILKKFLIGLGIVIIGLAYFAHEGDKIIQKNVEKCNEGNKLACREVLDHNSYYSDITNPEF